MYTSYTTSCLVDFLIVLMRPMVKLPNSWRTLAHSCRTCDARPGCRYLFRPLCQVVDDRVVRGVQLSLEEVLEAVEALQAELVTRQA